MLKRGNEIRKEASILAGLLFVFIYNNIFADSIIQNITISPSNPATNSNITITFQIKADDGQGNAIFGIGLSQLSDINSDNNICKVNWLAIEERIYQDIDYNFIGYCSVTLANGASTDHCFWAYASNLLYNWFDRAIFAFKNRWLKQDVLYTFDTPYLVGLISENNSEVGYYETH